MFLYAFIHSFLLSLCLLGSQDGKTAEDLAYKDQHEPIVSLLGKLKKVQTNTHTLTFLNFSFLFFFTF